MESSQRGEPVRLPHSGIRLWSIFWELDSQRTNNGFSYLRLTHSDILSYCTLMRVLPQPWEVKALLAMDRIRVVYLNQDKSEQPSVSQRPLTEELFDALFGG